MRIHAREPESKSAVSKTGDAPVARAAVAAKLPPGGSVGRRWGSRTPGAGTVAFTRMLSVSKVSGSAVISNHTERG
jgi:hypothetical protein